MHVDDDCGEHENIFGLDKAALKKRTVQFLDIATEKLPKEHQRDEYEPSLVKSAKTGRGPLTGDWQRTMRPVMCCYKLVTIKAHIFALQARLERYTLGTQEQYFVKFYKKVFCLLDDWIDLDMAVVREMEDDLQGDMASKLDSLDLDTKQHDVRTQTPLNSPMDIPRSPPIPPKATRALADAKDEAMRPTSQENH